ncbi:hypothetical protein KP509_05G064100 [Ceratopteris richardii]|nr:hypothetical protein KP509_05G064100 [Ceratopteris richardii]
MKDPHKPPSPGSVSSSKQIGQGKKMKDLTVKTSDAKKDNTMESNTITKVSMSKAESLKSPRHALRPKSPRIKLDESKSIGTRKPNTPDSSLNQKILSSGGGKTIPTFDVNASLCSECTRSASGTVCFIGNDGRVSACPTRSAVRLCKNLNCAANNPDYVAAANAPKKYLVSKRHLLKAQFGPKDKSGTVRPPNKHRENPAGTCTVSESPSDDAVGAKGEDEKSFSVKNTIKKGHELDAEDGDLSLFEGGLRQFDGETNLLDGNILFDKYDETTLESGDPYMIEGSATNGCTDFSFYDGETIEPQSPRFLIIGSSKEHNGTDLVSDNDNQDDGAESWAVDSFECDDDDSDDKSVHEESKMKDSPGDYGCLTSSKETDYDYEPTNEAKSEDGVYMVPMVEINDHVIPQLSEEMGHSVNKDSGELATEVDKGENGLQPELFSNGNREERDQSFMDQNMANLDGKPTMPTDNNDIDTDDEVCISLNDEDSSESKAKEDEKRGDSTACDVDDGLEKDIDEGSVFLADSCEDYCVPIFIENKGTSSIASSMCSQTDHTEVGVAPLCDAENELGSSFPTFVHDNRLTDNEEFSDGYDVEDDGEDTPEGQEIEVENNVHSGAQGVKNDTIDEGVTQDHEGTKGNCNSKRPRRRRILHVVEDVSPETVTLRKQQMLERKQREEWMANHAIEGVMHKLAPTGENKVKILVEAFESIISLTEVGSVDANSLRQEKQGITE